MVFSALLHSSPARPGNKRKLSSSSAKSDASSEYISDDSQLGVCQEDDEAPDLRDLNGSLEALAVVFPDVQVEVFREMLSSFSEESRLAVVADALLKNRVGWVKGRWRQLQPQADGTALVPKAERFKSPEYIAAAKDLAWHEFKGLSRSTINAVLAESNYSYLFARKTLVDLSQKSWRFTLSSLLLYRRKTISSTDTGNHPLVVWKSSGQGSIVPSLKSTGNAELDRELFGELIEPLRISAKEKTEEKDREMAAAMNLDEAERENQTHECCCCFTAGSFEDFTTCNTNGHMICRRCVQLSVTEAVFGQSWAKTIEPQTGTLRCPAMPENANSDSCDSCISFDQIHRAMLDVKKGAEILRKFDQRLAEYSLLASGLPLARCPFCDYAEVDDVYLTSRELQPHFGADGPSNGLLRTLHAIAWFPFLVILAVVYLFIALLAAMELPFGKRVLEEFSASLKRHSRRQRGLKFTCQAPDCGRSSCLHCEKEWIDIHVCNESSLIALRTQVEQAMSMAVKRVCPKCNASFVKTAGCNKMTCQCGYKMCYVCRKDIGGKEGGDAGYQHFCQHFRPEGDGRPCNSCNKCNLWQKEDTDHLLQKAKEEAEQKWKEVEHRKLSGAELAYLETGVASTGRGVEAALTNGRVPTITEVCDMVVSTLFGH